MSYGAVRHSTYISFILFRVAFSKASHTSSPDMTLFVLLERSTVTHSRCELERLRLFCSVLALKGVPLRADSRARREGEEKEGVKGGEGEESTPKPVPAGPQRQVPLLFKLPRLFKGRWSDENNT